MKSLVRTRIVLLVLIVLSLLGAPAAFGASAEQVQEVRELLEQYHLSKPDDSVLSQSEMEEMVGSLDDPYTVYFDDDQWKSFNSALEMTFVGIGIVMTEDNGKVYVQDVIPSSPAEESGVLPGDALVGANGKSFKGKTTADIQQALLGKEGSKVKLTVSRGGKNVVLEMERRAVQLPIVTTHMLEKGVGYLQLTSFSADSGNAVKTGLEKLEKSGMTSLVLDLRDNGGGYVNAAQFIAGLFIEKGILAHMLDRDEVDHPLEISGAKKPYSVVILVNGNTASASELLSAALREYGVAKLVGTKTYGKGVVQSIVPVQSGGMLKVTIEEYFTPTGKKVNKVGLTPNMTVSGDAEQLIAAYRLAGGKKLTLTSERGVLVINGVRIAQSGATLLDKNVWYVDLDLAAAMAGAKLTYDAKTKTYALAKGKQIEKLKASDSHLRTKNGETYIDVRLLAKKFAGITFSVKGDALKLAAAS